MTETAASALRRDPSDVRFSTRPLLIMMAVVAAACTGLSAFVQYFPKEARPRVIVYRCIFFTLLAICIACDAWRRVVAERRAGRALYSLPLHSYFLPRAPRFAAILLGTCFALTGPALWVVSSFFVAANVGAIWMQLLSWQSYVAVVFTAAGITYFWWHRQARVGEHGYVVRYTFTPWLDCRRWYWDAGYRDVVVLETAYNERVAMKVPDENRQAIEDLLANKTISSTSRALVEKSAPAQELPQA